MTLPLERYLVQSQRQDASSKETVPSIASKTDSEQHSESISRNHSCEKMVFNETAVSSNAFRQLPQLRRSSDIRCLRHSSLHLIDHWRSEWTSVQKMLDYLHLRKSDSLQSARIHCRILDLFCRGSHAVPDELVKLPRDQIEMLLQHHCDRLMERSRLRGPSSRYANTALACLKTFFVCNGYNIGNGKALRISNYRQPPRTTNRPEYVPVLKDALAMGERAGNKRDRAIILTLITTGLRNSSARALLVGDILDELRQGKRELLIKVEVKWNERIPGACKGRVPYYTFTAKIAIEAINSMLEERKIRFGSYLPQEPLFISNHNQIPLVQRRMTYLSKEELQIIVKKAARATDITQWKNVHVHTLRKVFESVLRSPLVDGGRMDIKDQEFLMGHILPGPQENYYDHSNVERLRQLYAKLVFEDRSHVQEASLETTRKIAKVLGVDLFKAKAMKEKELGRPLSNQEEEELLEQEIKLARERQNQEEQRIIIPSELDQYIASGWSVGLQLMDGRVVVRRRSTTAP